MTIQLNIRIERTAEEIERGECPVPDGASVRVTQRNGYTTGLVLNAKYMNWGESGDDTIVAYEIHALPEITDAEVIAGLRAAPKAMQPFIAAWLAKWSDISEDEFMKWMEQ